MPPGDLPRLTAVDEGDNISHVIYNSTTGKVDAILALMDSVDDVTGMDLAFEAWMGHCDALLSDTPTIARLQVCAFQMDLVSRMCLLLHKNRCTTIYAITRMLQTDPYCCFLPRLLS